MNKKQAFIEEHFFRPRWYSVFFNPYFINRRSILLAIQSFAKQTSPQANILDVGCGLKPYRQFFSTSRYTGIDIAGGGHSDAAKVVDAFYDGHHIPFPDNSFDTLICTQVLEHADDAELLVSECSRVLSPGGQAFFSMPFTYPEHETPYDFRRFTSFEHARLYKKYGFSESAITGTTGFFGTFGQLFVIWIFEGISFRAPLLKALLTALILAPLQILALALDRLCGKRGLTMDYVIIAKK
jgi:SAM-dependent methyltransferase